MRFAKIVFLVGGIYGLLVIVPLFFLEQRIAQEMPPAISHPEHYYGFAGLALAWQVLFLILAHDPMRYRAMMIPCILEKFVYGIALVVLFAQQRIPVAVLAIGSIDWIFVFLFTAAYVATPSEPRNSAVNPEGNASHP
jgi:hypothetical protein